MTYRVSMHCLLLSALLVPAGLAQTPDSLLRGRHCTPGKSTQWVDFGEIGDTAPLIAALREAAGTDEAVTAVRVEYKEDGRIAGVHAIGARSHRAAKDLETEFRAHLSQLGALPKHFSVEIARLNATDHVELLPLLFTCPPERLSRSQSDSALRMFSQQVGRLTRLDIDKLVFHMAHGQNSTRTLIEAWLEASGDVRTIWIQESSGDSAFDQLALNLILTTRWLPLLVGSRAAPARVQVPVAYLTGRDTLPRSRRRFP